MDQAFFHDPGLPEPKYNPDVGSGSHAGQTSRIVTGIEKVLMEEQPDIVLVQGDTNTVLAGKADLVIGSRFLKRRMVCPLIVGGGTEIP
ncbi:MAG: hypothetical protein STSR0009_32070 [Methanoregula sp.]